MTRNTALSSTDPGQYLTQRLVDALIREDVAGCQSDSQAVGVDSVPWLTGSAGDLVTVDAGAGHPVVAGQSRNLHAALAVEWRPAHLAVRRPGRKRVRSESLRTGFGVPHCGRTR